MWGGPSAVTGGLDISWCVSVLLAHALRYLQCDRTETGVTLDGEQSFSAFLGPMCTELQEKYRQWLRLTYSTFLFPFLATANC